MLYNLPSHPKARHSWQSHLYNGPIIRAIKKRLRQLASAICQGTSMQSNLQLPNTRSLFWCSQCIWSHRLTLSYHSKCHHEVCYFYNENKNNKNEITLNQNGNNINKSMQNIKKIWSNVQTFRVVPFIHCYNALI